MPAMRMLCCNCSTFARWQPVVYCADRPHSTTTAAAATNVHHSRSVHSDACMQHRSIQVRVGKWEAKGSECESDPRRRSQHSELAALQARRCAVQTACNRVSCACRRGSLPPPLCHTQQPSMRNRNLSVNIHRHARHNRRTAHQICKVTETWCFADAHFASTHLRQQVCVRLLRRRREALPPQLC